MACRAFHAASCGIFCSLIERIMMVNKQSTKPTIYSVVPKEETADLGFLDF